MPRTTPSFARNASVVALAFVLSRVLGLVREVILANQFGTSDDLSAYVAAFRVPDLLFLIIMAGSFGSAFIPVFAGMIGKGENRDAWKLASSVLNIAALALALSAAVAFIFAEPLVRTVVAPDASPAVQEIATNCMRMLMLSPVFLGLGIAAKGILEGQDRFDLPAFAPVVYNVATILGALVLGPIYGVYGVAIGVVAGAFGHLLIQVPGLIRSGMRYTPNIDLRTPGLRQVGRLLGPRIIGQAAFQINFIALTSLAWRTGGASVAALNYGWQLLMLPHGVLALSISTVVFPAMSRLFQAGDTTGFRTALARAVKPLIFLSLPAAIGLFFFRTAIVQTVFQSGAFSAESTSLVTIALFWFALALPSYAVVEVLTRAFYAMQDTVTPVVTGVGIIVLNIVLAATLIDRYGYGVLAFSLGVSTTVEAIALLVVLRLRIGGIDRDEWRWLAKTFAAGLAMTIVSLILAAPITAATAPGVAPRVVQIAMLLIALGLVAALYLVSAWLLHIPELDAALKQIISRVPGMRRLARLVSFNIRD